LGQVREEVLVAMLCVELCGGCRGEAGHLQFVEHKATLLDLVDNLAHLGVAVGLDHCESPLALVFEVPASVNIAVVSYFKDAG
jgi:hypothetical protein